MWDTKWYKSTITGKYFWEFEAKYIGNEIYGADHFDQLIENGILVPIDPPCVIDLLKQKREGAAARRYSDIHHVTISKAYNMLKRIKEDVEKYENRG